MEVGDIIVFKGQGLLFQCLSRLLKIFERGWDRWGWHTAFVSRIEDGIPVICEALAQGVVENYFDADRPHRVYKWFDQPVDPSCFVSQHIGEKYDIAIYFWTTVAVLVRHFWNRPIPKLLDRRFSCWEVLQEFTAEMGKPIVSKYDVIILTDILKVL